MASQIFFIGYMGAGKSSTAKRLGDHTGHAIADLDAMISKRMGMSISRIFETLGEQRFRDMEGVVLAEVAGNPAFPIVACGGGLPCSPQNWKLMQSHGFVIWLDPAFEILFTRLQGDGSRPLLKAGSEMKDEEAIRSHHALRSACYQACDERFEGTVDTSALERWSDQLHSH